MRTDLQIEASRANGNKSQSKLARPYPRNTEAETRTGGQEGKLASSRNALKHGILSSIVLLPGEDAASFEADAQDLFDEHKPVGPTEQEFVELMIVARWRRTRAWMRERTCMAGQLMREHHEAQEPKPSLTTATALAFVTMADNSRTLDLLNRYESRYDRQYFRAHRRLLEVQDRRMRNEPDNTPPPAPGPETNTPAPGVTDAETDSAKRTQADVSDVENKAPVARRPFYLIDILPPEAPVFHAAAGIHPS